MPVVTASSGHLVSEDTKCYRIAGRTPKALVREIKEELDVEISVQELFDTVEYDYPGFHLTMHCFISSLKAGEIVLNEHEDARWLYKEELDTVAWLPADEGLIEKLKKVL